MTSLADALTAAAARKPGPRCTVSLVLGTLPAADRELLADALTNRAISNEALFTACRDAGIDLTLAPLSRHRRGGCDCPKVGK